MWGRGPGQAEAGRGGPMPWAALHHVGLPLGPLGTSAVWHMLGQPVPGESRCAHARKPSPGLCPTLSSCEGSFPGARGHSGPAPSLHAVLSSWGLQQEEGAPLAGPLVLLPLNQLT